MKGKKREIQREKEKKRRKCSRRETYKPKSLTYNCDYENSHRW